MLAVHGTKPEFRNSATGFISSVGSAFPSSRQLNIVLMQKQIKDIYIFIYIFIYIIYI